MTPFGIQIDGQRFLTSLVSKKVERFMRTAIFEPLGRDNLLFLISKDKSYIRMIPPEVLVGYLQGVNKDIAGKFTNEDIYRWVPKEYLAVIESVPEGKRWAMGEIEYLRGLM